MEELIIKMGNLNHHADDDVIPVESMTFDELYDRAMSCCEFPYFEETKVYFQDRDDCYRLSKEEDRKSMMAECAEKTLDYFNRINLHLQNTDYKFEKYVELILSTYEHSHAIHCNFIAKPDIAPLKAEDFSAKLFFAELIPFRNCERWVTDCAMLHGGEDEIKKECLMCPQGVISHPLSFQDGTKLPLENTEGFELILASENTEGNLNQHADDDVIPVESMTFDELYDRAMSCCGFPYFEETKVFFQDRDDCYRLLKEEDRKSMMAECAEKTLDYFNRINDTDYKFEKYVELILSTYEHSHAIHCNFIAKPEIAPLKAGDFSAKLFFAELIPFGISERWVTDCAMLDGGEDEIKKECLMCPPGVISHPLSFQDGTKLPLENTEGFELVLASEDMDYL